MFDGAPSHRWRFQSTPPPEEGDVNRLDAARASAEFQSTPPRRRATGGLRMVRQVEIVSIHAPPGGGRLIVPDFLIVLH